MKPTNTLALSVLLLALLTACEKKPVASFTADKEIYRIFDTVRLTNTSTNADSYEWSYYPKNNYNEIVKSTSTNLEFVIIEFRNFYSFNKGEGYVDVTLKATSKSGKKQETQVNKLPLKAEGTKYLIFWTANPAYVNKLNISTGSRNLGYVTKAFSTPPTSAYESGTNTYDYYPGIEEFTFSNGTST
ncbi:MAG: hypothetical protein H7331_09005, partial [Bacteroidia bacterium]|nr:hypothetical protein [Bacteroidia bacterium]